MRTAITLGTSFPDSTYKLTEAQNWSLAVVREACDLKASPLVGQTLSQTKRVSLRSLLYELLSRVLVEAEMPASTAKDKFDSVDPGALKSRYDDRYLYILNVCKEWCIQIRQHLRHPKHMMGTLLNMQGDKHWLTFVRWPRQRSPACCSAVVLGTREWHHVWPAVTGFA